MTTLEFSTNKIFLTKKLQFMKKSKSVKKVCSVCSNKIRISFVKRKSTLKESSKNKSTRTLMEDNSGGRDGNYG
jgi:hypothetical protein